MRVLEIATAVVLTLAASVGIIAMSWHRTAVAGTLDSAPPPALTRARGTLKALDASAGKVRLEVGPTPVEVRLGDSTTVFIDGRLATTAELHEGQWVCAAWEDGPDPTLDWIEPCGR